MTEKPQLYELSATYTQESDSNDDTDLGQDIKITSTDSGGGKYLVIETRRWAIDNSSEIVNLLNRFEVMIKGEH